MRTKIVRIGNSRGVRLPKPLLEQAGLSEEVELEVRNGSIVIRAAAGGRHGWAEAAQRLASRQEDELLDEPLPTRFDEEEWDW